MWKNKSMKYISNTREEKPTHWYHWGSLQSWTIVAFHFSPRHQPQGGLISSKIHQGLASSFFCGRIFASGCGSSVFNVVDYLTNNMWNQYTQTNHSIRTVCNNLPRSLVLWSQLMRLETETCRIFKHLLHVIVKLHTMIRWIIRQHGLNYCVWWNLTFWHW